MATQPLRPVTATGRSALRTTADTLILAGGALGFVASLLPFVSATYNGPLVGNNTIVNGVSAYASSSVNAWQSYATVGVLALLAATALHAVRLFAPVRLPALRIGWGLVTALSAAVGTGLIALRAITWVSGTGGFGYALGIGYGGYLLIGCGAVVAVVAFIQVNRGRQPLASAPPQQPRQQHSTASANPAATSTVELTMRQLADLRAAGYIGDAEYHELRQRALRRLVQE
ncbi:MAG TPA: hypothetical protein VGM75_02990 [Pseudonocardiaceae bacterium]